VDDVHDPVIDRASRRRRLSRPFDSDLCGAGGAYGEFELIADLVNSYNANMPTISTFYGILIRMFFNDHAPPHFHVQYAEFKATVEIKTLTIATGELLRRAQELVLDWAELHQQELLEDWRLCMEKQQPNAIAPLK
jgi:hypothetical protein